MVYGVRRYGVLHKVVYGVWCMVCRVYGVRCIEYCVLRIVYCVVCCVLPMVHKVWCIDIVYGVLRMDDIRCMVHRVWCMVYGACTRSMVSAAYWTSDLPPFFLKHIIRR